MVKRQAMQSIESQKHQMIAALYANTNLDMEENDRPKRIKDLEGHFNTAIEIIYNDGKDLNEQEIDWSNPFWSAAKRSHERQLAKLRGERGETVAEVLDSEAETRSAAPDRQRSFDQVP